MYKQMKQSETDLIIKELWNMYDKYEDREHVICGDAAKLIRQQHDEIATLEKALGKYRNTEQWLDDMANPLEPIKIQAALDSEIMKLNFRKEHKPESISELDGTIIAALMFALEAKEDLNSETNII